MTAVAYGWAESREMARNRLALARPEATVKSGMIVKAPRVFRYGSPFILN
jgi:hypothetical protein